MPVAQYTLGPAVRPNIQHDNGFLDSFPPHAPTWSTRLRYAQWRAKADLAESIQHTGLPHSDLSDALAAYRHFLNGSGADRTFSYERYVRDDDSGKITLENAISDAEEGASLLYHKHFAGRSGRFSITGSRIACGSPGSVRFPYPATENWQKAIGAHSIWLSGEVQVTVPAPIQGVAAEPRFQMDFILHAEDRYNFNPGAADIATGIPDSANGEFELTGLAKQYTNYATLRRTVGWTEIAAPVVGGQPANRQRQPNDNRRVRNRM